jgi:hypothetical protein
MSSRDKDNEEKTESKGAGAFFGAMMGDIFTVLIFFLCGSIFLSLSLFYTKYKMNGRNADEPPYTTVFPYKNMFTDSESQMWIYRFGRWITNSVIFSFSNNRYYLDKIMEYSGDIVKTSVKDNGLLSLLALLAGPFIMTILVMVSYVAGWGSTLLGSLLNIEQMIPSFFEAILLALPLLIPLFIYPFFLLFSAGSVSMGVGIVQFFMMLGFFMITPFMNASMRQDILNTLMKHRFVIFLAMFALITSDAFKLLGDTAGYVSLGITIAALLVFIFMRIF